MRSVSKWANTTTAKDGLLPKQTAYCCFWTLGKGYILLAAGLLLCSQLGSEGRIAPENKPKRSLTLLVDPTEKRYIFKNCCC